MSDEVLHREWFPCWALIRPAEDLPGQWVAHCLEFDVVSQGDSPKHALEMIVEATAMVIEDDLNSDRNPHSRRAPSEFWDELRRIQERGQKVDDLEVFLARRGVQQGQLPFILAVSFGIIAEHQADLHPVGKSTRLPAFACEQQIAC